MILTTIWDDPNTLWFWNINSIPCIEPSFPVLDHSTTHPACLCPHHLAVVACLVWEAVPGNTAHWEDVNLVVPRIDCLSPILYSFSCIEGLVKILSHLESTNSSTVCAVMAKLALVRMPLGHAGQLLVPLQLLHITGWRLACRPNCNPGP